jgi:hypothetical protein
MQPVCFLVLRFRIPGRKIELHMTPNISFLKERRVKANSSLNSPLSAWQEGFKMHPFPAHHTHLSCQSSL